MSVKPSTSPVRLLPYFPAGFPDETIGSRVSRYHILRGCPTMHTTYKHLFGKPPFGLTGLVQPHLAKLAERLPGSHHTNLLELQHDSTLLPLFQQFFGPKTVAKRAVRAHATPLIELPRRINGDSRLTYLCSHCLIDDERDHGWPYIHRAHQIPGVTACWKHATRLLDCCPSCAWPFAQPNQLILSAWMGCECGCSIADHAQADQQQASDVEIEFSRFAQALLAAEPRRLSIDQLIHIYKARAFEIGCGWGDDRVNHKMLFGKIEAHFGKELFSMIDPTYKSGKMEHWLNILYAHSSVEAPLTRHLMAAYFLFRDPALFLSRADTVLHTKPELGDLPHIFSGAPTLPEGKVSAIEKQPAEELLDELVNLAQRDDYDIPQLWRHHYTAMKRIVKLLPNAGDVIERRLKIAAIQKKRNVARALITRERNRLQDAQWSESIKASSAALYGENAKPIRITRNKLLTASIFQPKGTGWPKEPAFPLSVAASKAHEESIWHFYARRLLWTLQCLHDPETPAHKIIILARLEVNKARVVMDYFSDFVPCGGGSIPVIKSILKERGISKDWQGPCPEREFYRAGRAYLLRTARRGPIGGRAGDEQPGD